jgi:hypothetical protein
MPTRIKFDDVTPPEKRSIRNIPIPKSSKRKQPIIITPENQVQLEPKKDFIPLNQVREDIVEKKDQAVYQYYYPQAESPVTEKINEYVEKPKKKRRFLYASIVVLAVLAFIFGMMTVFASATVEVTPKTLIVSVSDPLVLALDNTVTGALRYEVVRLSKTKTVSLKATGEEAVETKASGKIIIYNNFSEEPQRLIVRTRFETPEGLIYRIAESVVVPGKTVKGTVETPGSIEAVVYADEPGEKYNIGKTDFTIPGFKNDASRFKSFYARSASDMTGGFIGKRKTVETFEKEAAFKSIDEQLRSELTMEMDTKVPEGMVMLDGSQIFESFESSQNDDGSSVTLGREGILYTLIINEKDLSDKLVATYMASFPAWQGINAKVMEFSGLKISKKPDSFGSGGKIDIEASGSVKVTADLATDSISEILSGKPRREAAMLIDEFGGISSVKTTIRPMWKRSFPGNPLKIHTILTYQESSQN